MHQRQINFIKSNKLGDSQISILYKERPKDMFVLLRQYLKSVKGKISGFEVKIFQSFYTAVKFY